MGVFGYMGLVLSAIQISFKRETFKRVTIVWCISLGIFSWLPILFFIPGFGSVEDSQRTMFAIGPVIASVLAIYFLSSPIKEE